MRAILLGAWLISACSITINHNYNETTSIVNTAGEWVGLHQSHDRAQLREFLGVDPVQIEWCAAFVNSVLHQLDIPGSESVHRYPLLARSFLRWGEPVELSQRQVGDVVIFPRGWQGWQGHVGFYVGTEVVNGVEYLQILGGNQSNSVNIALYPAYRAIGVRRWPLE